MLPSETPDASPIVVRNVVVAPQTFRARALLLYLCAAGCPACKQGDEQVREIAARLRAPVPPAAQSPDHAGVPVAALTLNTSLRSALRTRRRHRWTFPVYIDPTGDVRKRLGRIATPCFCLLRTGPRGPILAACHRGVFDSRQDMLAFADMARRIAAGNDPPSVIPALPDGQADEADATDGEKDGCRSCCYR